jgi:dihydrodipicolinate reductase
MYVEKEMLSNDQLLKKDFSIEIVKIHHDAKF